MNAALSRDVEPSPHPVVPARGRGTVIAVCVLSVALAVPASATPDPGAEAERTIQFATVDDPRATGAVRGGGAGVLIYLETAGCRVRGGQVREVSDRWVPVATEVTTKHGGFDFMLAGSGFRVGEFVVVGGPDGVSPAALERRAAKARKKYHYRELRHRPPGREWNATMFRLRVPAGDEHPVLTWTDDACVGLS